MQAARAVQRVSSGESAQLGARSPLGRWCGAAGGVVKQGHFRQGTTGGWRELMSDAQAAAFDAKTAELVVAGGGGQIFRNV